MRDFLTEKYKAITIFEVTITIQKEKFQAFLLFTNKGQRRLYIVGEIAANGNHYMRINTRNVMYKGTWAILEHPTALAAKDTKAYPMGHCMVLRPSDAKRLEDWIEATL